MGPGIVGLALGRFLLVTALDPAFDVVALVFGDLLTAVVFGFDFVEHLVFGLAWLNQGAKANK
jgi:hypothetical protein